ncbi:MAG TPA: AAA-associated domain-containing protein [Bryobacteraceae bacterium]|nr:AAA-associated domain-containing protein [Bryobacteraceae bacterium]
MNPPRVDKLRAALSEGNWDRAIAMLQKVDPAVAADVFQEMPFDQQQILFRRLPLDFAAQLVAAFPYYHAYVLLHSRPVEELTAIVERMQPTDRIQFIEQLPEETWQHLMDELHAAPIAAEVEVPAPAPVVPAAPAEEPIIQARRVEKRFQRPDGASIQVIAPTDLSVDPGMILALLGPSGSGKSTLLRMLSGLAQPTAGEVLWRGKPFHEATPNVAIVFQSFALFPWLTVLENVEVPLLARGQEHSERHQRAIQALATVGLTGFENAYPKELSGGMKQRVGFARALAVEPEILFMDEPFSALDVLTAENLRNELLELWQGKRMPTKSIFLVTHNIEEAVLLADRIIVLGRNPAKIRADFRVPLTQPRDRNSAEFLLYVDYIYKLMTQPELEAGPSPAGREVKPRYQMLPHARSGSTAGLLELLNDRGGKDDIYHVADELQMEVDDLLPILEAVTLLGFAKADKGDVEITPEGKAFAEADIVARKHLFRDAALSHITLLQQMRKALESKSDHRMPLEFFRDVLDEHFSDPETQRQIETALNWGRYGDILSYQSESDEISLFEPHALDIAHEAREH